MSLPHLLATIDDTSRVAKSLATDLRAGDVIALTGALGAGKTHFSQGLVAGLGSEATVTSPTFGIVHEYPDGRLPVAHFDFYRLESEDELLERSNHPRAGTGLSSFVLCQELVTESNIGSGANEKAEL